MRAVSRVESAPSYGGGSRPRPCRRRPAPARPRGPRYPDGTTALLRAVPVRCSEVPAPPSAAPEAAGDPLVGAMLAPPLVETRHGRCRMARRHIDREEVAGVLASGTLDPSHTRTNGAGPSHAPHGTTRDGQRARVVLASGPDEAHIVTVIDLDANWPCECE